MKIIFFMIGLISSAFLLTSCKNMADEENEIDLSLITPSVPFNDGFYNPIKTNRNLGDPWLMQHTDGLYYYSGGAINIFSTPTISGLMGYDAIGSRKKNVLVDIAPPHLREIWAPEVHHYNGRWYVFFTATHGGVNGSRERRENRRSYVLRSYSDDAFGEWEYMGQMDLPEGQWAIDPTIFEHKGKLYCIWSGWIDPSQGVGVHWQRLYITELEEGDPTKVKPGAKRVEISNPYHSWESQGANTWLNEGPCVVTSPAGSIFCIYSANSSTSNNYRLGYIKLTGDDPMDASNWVKNSTPLLEFSTANEVYGVGHNSIVMSPDKTEYWVIFHAAKASGAGWDRSARAQRLFWGANGDTPTMGSPSRAPDPTYLLQPIPSGEKPPNRLLFEAEDMILENASIVDIPATNGRGAKAVRLGSFNSSITMNVLVENGGYYAVQLRHTNSSGSEQEFRVHVNGSDNFSIFRASRGGNTFVMDAIAVILLKGMNTLKFSANTNMDVDCVIMERLDHHPW